MSQEDLSSFLSSLGSPLPIPVSPRLDYFSDVMDETSNGRASPKDARGHAIHKSITNFGAHESIQFDELNRYIHTRMSKKDSTPSHTVTLSDTDRYFYSEKEWMDKLELNKTDLLRDIQKLTKKESSSPKIQVEKKNVPQAPQPKPEQTQQKKKFSSLTPEEHLEYLLLERKYSTKQIDQNSLSRFYSLKFKVDKEQAEYHSLKYEIHLKHKHKYQVIQPNSKEFVDKVMNENKKRIYTMSEHFKTIQEIDLTQVKPDRSDPILTQPNIVLRLGKCHSFQPPIKDTFFDLNRNLLDAVPSSEFTWKKRSGVPLAEDPAIAMLHTHHKFEFVMCSSSFCTLFDTNFDKYPQEWCLPVTKTQDFTIIEKPLPKSKYTLREKNNMYYKYAFLSVCLNVLPDAPCLDFNKDNTVSEELKSFVNTIENYTYTIWSLGNHKILIRSKDRGVIRDYSKNTGYSFVGACAKMDYFPGLGQEDFSWDEKAKIWAYSFIRSDCNVYIGRVNLENQKLLSFEKKNFDHFTNSMRPEVSIKLFDTILHSLDKLETGSFLLRHFSGYQNVTIQASCGPEAGGINFHHEYENAGSTDNLSIPYMPCIWSGPNDQIPYTFPLNKKVEPKSKPQQKNSNQKEIKRVLNKFHNAPPTQQRQVEPNPFKEETIQPHQSSPVEPISPKDFKEESIRVDSDEELEYIEDPMNVIQNDQDLQHIMNNFI